MFRQYPTTRYSTFFCFVKSNILKETCFLLPRFSALENFCTRLYKGGSSGHYWVGPYWVGPYWVGPDLYTQPHRARSSKEQMAAVDDSCTVLVRLLAGEPVAVPLPPASTVAHLKQLVQCKTAVAVESQRVHCPAPFF